MSVIRVYVGCWLFSVDIDGIQARLNELGHKVIVQVHGTRQEGVVYDLTLVSGGWNGWSAPVAGTKELVVMDSQRGQQVCWQIIRRIHADLGGSSSAVEALYREWGKRQEEMLVCWRALVETLRDLYTEAQYKVGWCPKQGPTTPIPEVFSDALQRLGITLVECANHQAAWSLQCTHIVGNYCLATSEAWRDEFGWSMHIHVLSADDPRWADVGEGGLVEHYFPPANQGEIQRIM